MIEVPVYKYALGPPLQLEAGEGAPATVPGYTLHGLWNSPGAAEGVCWQVRDDTISLCPVNVAVSEAVDTKPLKCLQFGASVLPSPCIQPLAYHEADASSTHRLLACTSKGSVKIVPLRLANGIIDLTGPSSELQLSNVQRVTGCVFLPKPDGSVWCFVGNSTWQRDDDSVVSEIKVYSLLEDWRSGSNTFREHAPLKFGSLFGRWNKHVAAFTAIDDPTDPTQQLIITLQSTDCVVYTFTEGSAPAELVKFAVATDALRVEVPANGVFKANVTATSVAGGLVLAFTVTKPTSAVILFRLNLIDLSCVSLGARVCPLPSSSNTRASIRSTSTALYVAWECDALPNESTQAVPLLFAALSMQPRAPLLAVSCIPLAPGLQAPAEWRIISLASAEGSILRPRDNAGETGLCVLDGAPLGMSDVCFIARPGGLCVLRSAEPFETQALVMCVESNEDTSVSSAFRHPFVSFSIAEGEVHDDPFLKSWQQADTLVSLASPIIDQHILPRLLDARADELAPALLDVEFLLYTDVVGTDRVSEVSQADVRSVVRVAHELAEKVRRGYTTIETVAPIVAIGATQQRAFSMLTLALHAATLLSIAKTLAPDDLFDTVGPLLTQAIDSVALHAHTNAVLSSVSHVSVLASAVESCRSASSLFGTVRDTVEALCEIGDCPSASGFLNALLSSPVPLYAHVRAVFNLRSFASADLRRLVVRHGLATANAAHLSKNVGSDFSGVVQLLRVAAPEDQTTFLDLCIGLLPENAATEWLTDASVGNDPCVVYLYLTVRLLVHLSEELRKAEGLDSGMNRPSGTLGSALRSAAAALLPPSEQLLAGIVLWAPADWDLVSAVAGWSVEAALDSCSRAVHLTATGGTLDTEADWDTAFHAVLCSIDLRHTEHSVSLLVDAVLTSGPLAIQRFLLANWTHRLVSPIKVAFAAEPTSQSSAVVTIQLPPSSSAQTASYRDARRKSRCIAISVIGGTTGPGLSLENAMGTGAVMASGTAIKVPSQPGTDTYSVQLSAVLRDCAMHESRSVVLLIGFPGLIPRCIEASTSPTTPLTISDNYEQHTHPAAIVARALWSKGADKSIHELVSHRTSANHYEVLAQFYALRGEYKAAARSVYRIAERVRTAPRAMTQDLEAASSSLAMAKSLLLCGGLTSFNVNSDGPVSGLSRQGREEYTDKSPNLVTISDLGKRRTSIEAEIALLKKSSGLVTPLQLQQSSWEEILDMLVARRCFKQAADFAEAWGLAMDAVFTKGTAACCESTRLTGTTARSARRLWSEVLLLLGKHSDATVQWRYHCCVLRECLACGEDAPLEVVRTLTTHRPDLIIREYIRDATHSSMAHAAEIASSYLKWKVNKQPTTRFSPSSVIPVTLLDALSLTLHQNLPATSESLNTSALDAEKVQELSLSLCRAHEYLDAWPVTNAKSIPAPTAASLPAAPAFRQPVFPSTAATQFFPATSLLSATASG